MDETIENYMIPEIRFIIFRKCTPSWEMVENTLEGINLSYFVQGEAHYIVDNKTIDVAEGNLLVLPPGCTRKAVTSHKKPMHCFSVDFILKNSRNQLLSLPFPAKSMPGRHEDIIHLFNELTFSWIDKQPGYIIKCNGLLLQIIHRFLELIIYKAESYTGDTRITRVIRHIGSHYSEHVTAKMMADMVGLHPTYFGALFNQTIGMSFNRYLIQTRVKNAENLLSSGEYRVGDVAEICGFTDISHFYKLFKLLKGFPPSYSLPPKS